MPQDFYKGRPYVGSSTSMVNSGQSQIHRGNPGEFQHCWSGNDTEIAQGYIPRQSGVSNLELLDIAVYGGRCDVTLHGAAVQRSIWSVVRGVFDVRADVVAAERVMVLSDFDELSPAALSSHVYNS